MAVMKYIPDEIENCLVEAGIKTKGAKRRPVTEILEEKNLSLEKTVESLSNFVYGSDNALAYKATQDALKLHGVMNDTAQIPQIIFNITGGGNLMAVLSPRTL